jgi:CBS domain-containing protein
MVMQVKDIMTSNVEALPPDASIKTLALKMRELNLGTIPIEEDGRITGIVTDRDLVLRGLADSRDPDKTLARDIMSREVTFCYDDQDVPDVAHLMEEKKLYRLPVVTHDGKMVGLFSVSDLAQHAAYELTGEVMHAVSNHAR